MSMRRIRKKTIKGKIGRIARAAAFAGAVSLSSCAPVAPLLAMTPPAYPVKFSESNLELKGKTEKSFIELLKSRSATNIVRSRGYKDGKLISAITADYLDYVYLFNEGSFSRKFRINYDGNIPKHVFAVPKIVHYKDAHGVFLMAKDLEVNGKPVAEIMLADESGKEAQIIIPIEKQIARHGDLLNPYAGGENLQTGVFFTARNENWEVWGSAYRITITKGKVDVRRVALGELAGCSCFGDWKAGKDVFGINVD